MTVNVVSIHFYSLQASNFFIVGTDRMLLLFNKMVKISALKSVGQTDRLKDKEKLQDVLKDAVSHCRKTHKL